MAEAFATGRPPRVDHSSGHNEPDSRVTDERQRIALDLNSLVIAPLFQLALRLSGVASTLDDRRLSGAVLDCIDDVDRSIDQIRAIIFELGQCPSKAQR